MRGRAGRCNDAQHRAKERGESGLDVNSRIHSGGDEAERVLALIESGLRHVLQARLKKAGAAWLIRNDGEETTNEHQWTRIRCSGSEASQEDFCSLIGERFRRRSEAVKHLSLEALSKP